MASDYTIISNIQRLREKGIPEYQINKYKELAKSEQGGLDIAKNIGQDIVRPFAQPAAMISEGLRGKDARQNALERFAFKGTKFGTNQRGGVSLENAVNAALLATPAPETFGGALKLGAAVGSATGFGYGAEETGKLSDAFTHALLGAAGGMLVSGSLYGIGKGISYAYNKAKDGMGSVSEKLSNKLPKVSIEDDVGRFKMYQQIRNDDGIINNVTKRTLDLASGMNSTLMDEARDNPAIREEVKSQLFGNEKGTTRLSLFNDIRDAFKGIDDEMSAGFKFTQDNILGDVGNTELQKGAIKNIFLDTVKEFDPDFTMTMQGGIRSFNFGSKLSRAEQKSIMNLYDEVFDKPDTIASLVDTGRIISKGVPFDKSMTSNFMNFKKVLGGKYSSEASSLIDDPAWEAMNNDYGSWIELKNNLSSILGTVKKEPVAKLLDEKLTQIGRMFRIDKEGRKMVIGEFDKEAGTDFYNKFVANELIRDYMTSKTPSESGNIARTLFSVLEPAKTAIFKETIEPGITSAIGGSAVNMADRAISGGTNLAVSGISAGTKISGTLKNKIAALITLIADQNIPRGIRGLYMIILKELLFPSPIPSR